MAAVLTIGGTDHDLYFADIPGIAGHLHDVPTLNPAHVTTGLSLPPLPEFPAPRLNALFWPVTGLSHYAVGHVLVSNDTAATNGINCTLKLTDGDADTAREVVLFILNRRPLSDTRATLATAPDAAVEDPFDGWILTLADGRYVRRRTIAHGDTIARATWGQLINALGVAGGFVMPSASAIQALVHADYGTPDADAWASEALAGEGYSVAADAAAATVGLRLVVATDGTVSAQRAAESNTAYTAWLAATGRDEFKSGGIVTGAYSSPAIAQLDGADETVPGSHRMTDRDAGFLASSATAFRTRFATDYNDWQDATAVSADVRGFVLPPVCGTTQHVEYDLPMCDTRIVRHPARYPLPLMPRSFTLVTANVDGSQASVTRRLEFDQSTFIAVAAGATSQDPDVVAIDVDALKNEVSLTTANTDLTEESTTTRLEFDVGTGIRVDAGATASDPDVVSLTFGQSITFVECVSLEVTKDGGGFVTDAVLTVKKRTLTISDGATIGAQVCTLNPDECCPPPEPWECSSCPDPLPGRVRVDITGTCADLDVGAFVVADYTDGTVPGYPDAGWIVQYTQPNGVSISGTITCSPNGCFDATTRCLNFAFDGAVHCPTGPLTVVFECCTYVNQLTPTADCNPLNIVIELYGGLFTLTVSEYP